MEIEIKKAIYKVPNGKLLKIFLHPSSDGRIEHIRIMGDFFVYPEESIEQLEQALIGAALDETELIETLNSLIGSQKMELFGLDVPSLATTIMTASKS